MLEDLEHRRLLALLQYTPASGNETELIIEVNEQGAFGYSDDLAVNDPDDKEPFELEALVRFSLPLQRRRPFPGI